MATSSGSLLQFGQNVTKGLVKIAEGIMTKGQGSYVEFEDGRRMLDFTCGIGAAGLGG
jgi:4-aminobutyrate aminotransferase